LVSFLRAFTGSVGFAGKMDSSSRRMRVTAGDFIGTFGARHINFNTLIELELLRTLISFEYSVKHI
jgi:hypothetical protein